MADGSVRPRQRRGVTRGLGMRQATMIAMSSVLLLPLLAVTASDSSAAVNPVLVSLHQGPPAKSFKVSPKPVSVPVLSNSVPKRVDWPSAGATTVALPVANINSATADLTGNQITGKSVSARPGGLPISVAVSAVHAVSNGSGGASPVLTPVASSLGGGLLRLSVADHAAASAAGVRGVILSMTPPATTSALSVSLNYSKFASAYGGNYASRLRLVELPACALTTPKVSACRHQTLLPGSANDTTNSTLKATVEGATPPPLQGSPDRLVADQTEAGLAAKTMVLAASPGASSGAGSYAASSVSPSGTWGEGGNSGAFTYEYPITVPPADSSLAPKVSLNYNSQSVDGLTSATNNQPSWVGDGWTYSPGGVTRSYATCSTLGSPVPATGDLCWDGQVVQVSFDGQSDNIVNDPSTPTGWALSNDNGAVVQYKTGTVNGTYDGDYWEITTEDGTQYYFGMNHLPGWTTGNPTTNSAWTAPVYAPTAGEPCYNSAGFSSSKCSQAYEWALDYVVDSKGNALAYYYNTATNNYGADGGTTGASYVRDGSLDHISYGFTSSTVYSAPAPQEVAFTPGDRCVAATCDPISSNTANWPDVPYDLNCNTGAACTTNSPSFWSTVALSKITTQVYVGTSYQAVDTYNLVHTLPTPGDGENADLWLSSITHTGNVGGTASLPATSFSGQALLNRVNTADGYPLVDRFRINDITTETGEVIAVSYSSPTCSPTALPTPSTNTSLCYPVYWTPPGQLTPILDWFNKFLVTSVTENDQSGASAAQVTDYNYVGSPAWHYDDNEVVQSQYRTWGQWRGYPEVDTLTGNPTTNGGNSADPAQTLSKTIYFQGMNGDTLPVGTRTASVVLASAVTVPNAATSVPDTNQLSGMPREEITYNYANGPVDHAAVTDYWVSAALATRSRTGLSSLTANFIEPAVSYTTQAITSTGSTTWRSTETQTAYNISTGLPVAVDDSGDLTKSAQRTCTSTTYAPPNGSENLVDLPAEVEKDAGACATGNASTSDGLGPQTSNTRTDISDSRTYYDLFTPSTPPSSAPSITTPPAWPQAVPTRGNANLVYNASAFASGVFSYQLATGAVFDAYGRTVDAYDTDWHQTGTAYSPLTGPPTTVTVTNALSQMTSATLDPTTGDTLTSKDANGNITTETYDPLGRLANVWKPGEPTSGPASIAYLYSVPGGTTPPSVTTSALTYRTDYSISTEIYDDLGNTVETQSPSVEGGSIIDETLYDSHGWAWKTDSNVYSTSAPSTTLASFEDSTVQNQHVTSFDGLDRPVSVTDNQTGTQISVAKTVYGGDTITTIPPAGGLAQSTATDALGRTTEIDQYTATPTVTMVGDGGEVSGAHTATTSTYGLGAPAAQPATITDPLSVKWTFLYNLAGQTTSQNDPDAGTTLSTYNSDGSLKSTTDADGHTLTYAYDALMRKKSVTDGSTTVNSYTYDTATGGVGQPASSTSYSGGNAFTQVVGSYNALGLATSSTTTIPASEGTLAGSYTTTQGYDSTTGLVTSTGYPAIGGLPKETVNQNYNALGLPGSVLGTGPYENSVGYTQENQPGTISLGYTPQTAAITETYNLNNGNLTNSEVQRTSDGNVLDNTAYNYDPFGNITSEVDKQSNQTVTNTQCFDYNNLDQLTTAWAATDNCAADLGKTGATNSTVGGPAPYWDTWTYDAAGDRTTAVAHATTGSASNSTSTNYSYPNPATAGDQPHSLSATQAVGPSGTTTTNYGYDAEGNTKSISTTGNSETLTWNDQNQLATDNTKSGTTSYIYDASGKMLEQKAPGVTTLYLPNQQLVLNTSTNAVAGTRYYPLSGGAEAIRTASTAVYGYTFQLADPQGTPKLDLTAQTFVPTYAYYDPFGNAEGPTVTAPPADSRTFLNDPTNSATGLTTIGARQYQSTTGRFISVDPQLDTTSPQQLNGYQYAGDNPNTNSDPTGLWFSDGRGHIGSRQYLESIPPSWQSWGTVHWYNPRPRQIGRVLGRLWRSTPLRAAVGVRTLVAPPKPRPAPPAQKPTASGFDLPTQQTPTETLVARPVEFFAYDLKITISGSVEIAGPHANPHIGIESNGSVDVSAGHASASFSADQTTAELAVQVGGQDVSISTEGLNLTTHQEKEVGPDHVTATITASVGWNVPPSGLGSASLEGLRAPVGIVGGLAVITGAIVKAYDAICNGGYGEVCVAGP
jgi:RHS repeat-associated protein